MPEPSKSEYVVGVDLGGTKILSGLFDNSFECIGTAKVSTKAQRGMETVLSRIERCVRDAVDEADLSLKQVAGVGIGGRDVAYTIQTGSDPDPFLLPALSEFSCPKAF